MAKNTEINPLQTIVNSAAIRLAEQQYRLARYFTPMGFEPKRVDFDRVGEFITQGEAGIDEAFPQPGQGLVGPLDQIKRGVAEQSAILNAFKAQDVVPTLDADQLFTTAQANIVSPHMARYGAMAA